MEPLVSVVIITYNQAWCIEETIESVLNQTYKNFEVIVVDDGSTDETPERLAAFRDRVTYIRHPSNQGRRTGGGGVSRNTGIRRARGEFVAFLDGDDLWEREKLAVQVDAAQTCPDSGLIVVDGVKFDHQDGRILQETLLADSGDTLSADSMLTVRLYDRLLQGCMIETPSQVMVPVKIFRDVGLFDEGISSDYDFYIRVAAHYDVTLIKKRLTWYRYHPSSLSGPLERQHIQFAPINIAIWTRHLPLAGEEYRPVIRERIRQQVCLMAERISQDEGPTTRARATLALCQLVVKNPSVHCTPYIPFFLARLWCPGWLTRIAGSMARLVFRPKR